MVVVEIQEIAAVVLTLPADDVALLAGTDWAELFISASVRIETGEALAVSILASDDPRCERCWRYVPDVAEDSGLCGRCDGAVHG